MASMIRTQPKAMKIAFKVLKTPDVLKQKNDRRPSQARQYSWFLSTNTSS